MREAPPLLARALGHDWLLTFPRNRFWGAVFGPIGCPIEDHIMARTQLKAPPEQVLGKRPNQAFLQSHPRLELFQGCGV
jgi:hypothetical protein